MVVTYIESYTTSKKEAEFSKVKSRELNGKKNGSVQLYLIGKM
jgi:hypothetical protein